MITYYRERRAKSRRGERLYNARVAHEDRGASRAPQLPTTGDVVSGARAELR